MPTAAENFQQFANGITIVLVSPKTPGNIGAAARAAANFGFHRIRLVAPVANHLDPEARAMAAEAAPLLNKIEIFDTLQAAIADCRHTFATTKRTGRRRRALLSPFDMGKILTTVNPADGAAIVFGCERTGLSAEDLKLCNAIVTLQTHSDYNSLNLAQAVLLMMYETHRAFLGAAPGSQLMAERVDALSAASETVLRQARFIKGADPAQVEIRIRGILMRAKPTASEARLLHAALMEIKSRLAEKDA